MDADTVAFVVTFLILAVWVVAAILINELENKDKDNDQQD